MNVNLDNEVIWVVTDLDGTLMDHQYDYSPALETISLLKKNGIPLIPCTSKTASEVRKFRNLIDLKDPYIVENGGAIYGSSYDSESEWEFILGRSYEDLKFVLEKLSQKIDYKLIALNDLNTNEIKNLTGLSDSDIPLALDRHWSVPFLTPPEQIINELNKNLKLFEVNIYQGNRMSHLLSKRSHKGVAVQKLKDYLDCNFVKVIALGDSPNDLPLLQAADISVIIPSKDGPNKLLVESLFDYNFVIADRPHAFGWSDKVNELVFNK